MWTRKEVLATAALAGLGALALGVCWWNAAGERTFDDEKPWLITAIVVAALMVALTAVVVIAGFRRLRIAKDEVVSRFLLASPRIAASYLGHDVDRVTTSADAGHVADLGSYR